MTSPPDSKFESFAVVDDLGQRHVTVSRLAQGGQGTVFRTEDPRILLKIVPLPATDAAGRRQWRDRLGLVARLGLPDRLPVATPDSFVETDRFVGYSMRMLEDMVPLADLMQAPAKGVAEWYRATGGLRRRLRVLAQLADVLSSVHGEGLAYCDVSPHNLFVSADVLESTAWLIDTDNLRWTVPATGTPMYTPRFGAPELVRGDSANSSSADAWSLAVLIFQVLTLNHPFLAGALVEDGDPDELERQADRGELPWIDDAKDDRNRASVGIARPIVLTKSLRDLAERTFGCGRVSPVKRATAGEWAEALHRASVATLECAVCHGSFYANSAECAWCQAPATADHVIVEARVGPAPDPDEPDLLAKVAAMPPWWRAVMQGSDSLVVTRRMTTGEVGPRGRQPVLTLKRHPKGVYVLPEPGAEVFLTDEATEHRTRADRPLHVAAPINIKTRLRVGVPDHSHLMLRFVTP